MRESLSVTHINRINGPLRNKTMSTVTTASTAFLRRWRCWLCFFFFFSLVRGVKNEQSEGRQEKPGRQTQRVYWLVPSSSVDCDKFDCGNPLKADALPHQPLLPHHLSLPSFVLQGALCSRSVRSAIICLQHANRLLGVYVCASCPGCRNSGPRILLIFKSLLGRNLCSHFSKIRFWHFSLLLLSARGLPDRPLLRGIGGPNSL